MEEVITRTCSDCGKKWEVHRQGSKKSWSGRCKRCQQRAYSAEHAEELSRARRIWEMANVERRRSRHHAWAIENAARLLEYERARRAANAEYFRDRHRLKKFGLTRDRYLAMYRAQYGKCKFDHCEQSAAVVDHINLASGPWVRGLLCNNHNVALGHLHDSIEEAEDLIEYLRADQRRRMEVA